MAQSCGILRLPDVVLGRICSQFCPHCAGEDCLGGFQLPDSFGGADYFGTLASLAWVNLRIGRLAQATRLHVFCGRRDSLPLLVRTLLDRPELGNNIRVVRLGNRDKDSDRNCVLRELGTSQAADTLKGLAGLAEEANLDFLSMEGERRLLAPFEQLPPIEDSFFSLGDFYGSSQFWMSGDAPVAIPRIANARLNAFLLFNLAKKVKGVAILGEWPLAVFPELLPAPDTLADEAIHASQASHPDSLLPEVEILRFDSSNENPHRRSRKCLVDMNKISGILSHVSNARHLEIRGGEHLMPGQKVRDICRPSLKNITALDLTATSGSAITSILLCCNSEKLKHFRFTIPVDQDDSTMRNGSKVQAYKVVRLLEMCGVHESLETIHIDTTEAVYYANIPGRTAFTTVPSFSAFTALRRLTISADNIYYPSIFPRVLLRDGNTSDGSTDDGSNDDESNGHENPSEDNPSDGTTGDQTTGDENTGDGNSASESPAGESPADENPDEEETVHEPRYLRLVNFLPRSIESFEIVGIYAIHPKEVSNIPLECHPDGKLPNLKRVILRGLPKNSWVLESVKKCEYPVPLEEGEDIFDDWYHVMEHAHDVAPSLDEEVEACYAEVGVEYAFDMPEYFIHEYIGDWNQYSI